MTEIRNLVLGLKTFYCNDFHGHYMGGCMVTVAATRKLARGKFRKQLKKAGLWPQKHPWTVVEVKPGPAVVLFDGNY